MVHDRNDGGVLFGNAEKFSELFKEYPKKYDVREQWFPTDACAGYTHCYTHVGLPNAYRAKLCKFWSDVFHYKAACGVSKVFPKFEPKANETSLYAITSLRHGLPGPMPPTYSFMTSLCVPAFASGMLVIFWRQRRVNQEQPVSHHLCPAQDDD